MAVLTFSVQYNIMNQIHTLSASRQGIRSLLFIAGNINASMATDFVAKIMYLRSVDPREPVTIYINSGGGEVNAGLLIYDTIQACEFHVNIICAGMAASMAAIILAGG